MYFFFIWRFCYYIDNVEDADFDQLLPFDSCGFSPDGSQFFVPMHGATETAVVKRIEEISRPDNAQVLRSMPLVN